MLNWLMLQYIVFLVSSLQLVFHHSKTHKIFTKKGWQSTGSDCVCVFRIPFHHSLPKKTALLSVQKHAKVVGHVDHLHIVDLIRHLLLCPFNFKHINFRIPFYCSLIKRTLPICDHHKPYYNCPILSVGF